MERVNKKASFCFIQKKATIIEGDLVHTQRRERHLLRTMANMFRTRVWRSLGFFRTRVWRSPGFFKIRVWRSLGFLYALCRIAAHGHARRLPQSRGLAAAHEAVDAKNNSEFRRRTAKAFFFFFYSSLPCWVEG
jgi:hypothetical protein